MTTTLTFESLSTEWSHTDGEGFVRVVPTDGFRDGLALLLAISEVAEATAYYPEVALTKDKITIKVDDADQDTALELAICIDALLDETDA